MKTLYLVRHGKSSWKNPNQKDLARPLSKRGKNDVPKMGKKLKEMGEETDLIITSPAKRAYDTAKKIAKEIEYPVKKIEEEDKLYMADNENFINVIKNIKKTVDKLMVVSHNLGLTIFANFISDSDIVNIPTAGIVRIDFDTNKWKDIKNMKGKLIFFEYPKKDVGGEA